MLPRILYYCRSLPIPIKTDHLRRFQEKMIAFVWDSKGNRLVKWVLFRAPNKGGLGLYNLLRYYQAAQLTQISIVYSQIAKPDWVHMEREAVPQFKLDFLLWSHPSKRPAILAPILPHSMRIWDKLKNYPELVSPIRPLAHLFHNPQIPPGMNIGAFS